MLVYGSGLPVLFRSSNDSRIDAIADRVRAIFCRLRGQSLSQLSASLKVPADVVAQLIDKRERAMNPALLVDVIAGLVHEAGVDPQWLLTGEYDSAAHRDALQLGEDRTANGRRAVREFVEQQYRQIRRDAMFAWIPRFRSIRPRAARSTTPSAARKSAR
jgi:nicotinamide mononucleotide adenylyltransferase